MKKILLTLLLMSSLYSQVNRILNIAPTSSTSSIGNVTLPLMNPARNTLDKDYFSFSRVNWMTSIVNDMNYNYIRVERQQYGADVLFFNYGEQNQADEYGIILGQFTPLSSVWGFNWGGKAPGTAFGGLVKDYYWGVESKIVHHDLFSEKATGLIFGLGGYFPKVYKDLDVDVMIRNFGLTPKFGTFNSELPVTWNIGFSYPYKEWMFYGQNNFHKGYYTFGSGASYNYKDMLWGRLGYYGDLDHDLFYPTFGVDFKYDKYLVGMSYIYGDKTLPLSNTIRLTINLEL